MSVFLQSGWWIAYHQKFNEVSPFDSDFLSFLAIIMQDNKNLIILIIFKCAKQSTAGCDADYAVSGNELQNFQHRFA